MKVLLINGSARRQGNTFLALSEAAKQLEKHGVETEIVQIGTKPVRGCIACGQCKAKALGRCVFDDDIPVGFISCETFPDKKGITCQIMPVAVFKDFRRKGYGTKMVNGMKKGPFINEKVTCFSAIVHKENKAGLEFFKKNGFKKDKKRDSEILMKCFVK